MQIRCATMHLEYTKQVQQCSLLNIFHPVCQPIDSPQWTSHIYCTFSTYNFQSEGRCYHLHGTIYEFTGSDCMWHMHSRCKIYAMDIYSIPSNSVHSCNNCSTPFSKWMTLSGASRISLCTNVFWHRGGTHFLHHPNNWDCCTLVLHIVPQALLRINYLWAW